MSTQEVAETLALNAVSWLVGQPDLLNVFMGSTGIGEHEIKTRLQDPDFMAAVLDFLLMDDRFVLDFCDAQGIPAENLLHARSALPGGQQVHWT